VLLTVFKRIDSKKRANLIFRANFIMICQKDCTVAIFYPYLQTALDKKVLNCKSKTSLHVLRLNGEFECSIRN